MGIIKDLSGQPIAIGYTDEQVVAELRKMAAEFGHDYLIRVRKDMLKVGSNVLGQIMLQGKFSDVAFHSVREIERETRKIVKLIDAALVPVVAK